MFCASHSWGIAPSEFWAMTMPEWLELATHYAGQRTIAGTRITEDRLAELTEWADSIREKTK